MAASTLDSMARAVEESAVVLVLFAAEYKESEACRTEGEYSYQCKQRIVPVKVHSNYKYRATPWCAAS